MLKTTSISSPEQPSAATPTATRILKHDTGVGVNNALKLRRGIDPEADILFTRHSISPYGFYKGIFTSDNPTGAFEPRKQVAENPEVEGDLTKKGVQLAMNKAQELFENLDLEKDALIFVSSNEARAMTTANIYEHIAREKGFKILQPKNPRSVTESTSNSNVRIMNELGLNFDSPLLHSVFNPTGSKVVESINFDSLDSGLKERYYRARQIILDDDRGSFGENFFHHGEEVKEIFPEIETAQEMHEHKFLKLVKIAQRFTGKLSSSEPGKKVRILAFGHENYVSHALHEATGANSIGNCETVSIKI